MKSIALSIFLNKWSAGTNSSMLNISTCSRFPLCFTITFITAFIISHICEKAQLFLDFFGSLDLLYGFEFIFDDIGKIGYHAVGAPVAELFGGLELIDSPDSDSLAGVMRLFNELL